MKEFFRRNPKAESKADDDAEYAPKFSWKKEADLKSDVPDDMWIKCTNCKELIYSKEFENNKKVCHKCGYHFRLGARERIEQLVDECTFQEHDPFIISADPLGFVSLEAKYSDKILETRRKTGLNEAIISGIGRIEGQPVAVAAVDFAFQGGSMGSVFGEKLVRLIEVAIEKRLPLVTFSSSGGARMQEGLYSLMQMAKITAALARLGDHRLPYISVMADPVTGGVVASYASVADVILAEPGALIGFSGPRVIEQIIKQKLPPGFQTAEFFLEHGMLDQVVSRKELRSTIATLIDIYMPKLPAQENQAVEILVQEVVHG